MRTQHRGIHPDSGSRQHCPECGKIVRITKLGLYPRHNRRVMQGMEKYAGECFMSHRERKQFSAKLYHG